MRYFLAIGCLLGLLFTCSERERPSAPSSSLTNPDLFLSVELSGEYRWLQSAYPDPTQTAITPTSSGWEQQLVITDHLFIWQRNGQPTLQFPYVTLASPAADGANQFRIFDTDWSQARYLAQLSGDRLFLQEYSGEQLSSLFVREE